MGQKIDANGYPLEFDDGKVERAREQLFQHNMACWKAQWDADDLAAPMRAMRELMREFRRRPSMPEMPEWLVDAVAKLTGLAMSEEEKRARRDWRDHRTRWEGVVALYVPGRVSMEDARGDVSERLEGTGAKGGDAAVKTSYEIVEEAGGAAATFEDYKAVVRRRRRQSG